MLGGLFVLLSTTLYAQTSLRSAEDAFAFSVESIDSKNAQLNWEIPENYYLYQHKFEVKNNSKILPLNLPIAQNLYDENYGKTQVYYQKVHFNIPVEASKKYQVMWQGCAKDRICYPPQQIEFETDIDGLVALKNQAAPSKSFLDLAASTQKNEVTNAVNNTETSSQKTLNDDESAKDQMWSEKLADSSFIYGLLLFFGLGILLAFTPCSLPMIPILTSLIVRNNKGLKAWMIALVFVCSMAMVYAILGLIASSAGLNFQRWLQQPSTLIAFSLLFVAFALNLFGAFELKLPQALVNKLDHAQAMQQGGSLIGAAVMGMISALLVGPCMTAPLAGALLFISQTQSQWHGALLLFTLGFGMGTPLLIASILGSKFLPKVGMWMNQIKVIFAFIMLTLALYFVRPLLSEIWFQYLSLALGISFVAYVLFRFMWNKTQWKWAYIAILILTVPYMVYSQYQQSQRFFNTATNTSPNMVWNVAHTASEFHQILAQAPKDQGIIIDVYADWCVACQPIEHRILKAANVQQALQDFYLIKLDLSEYDAGHQALLNERDILGPPTYLFLNAEQQEIRNLRLTGAFSEQELLNQIEKFKQHLGD
ncbi:protein-disulfide reductase DsbD [Acinetobacter faecalis]|uniref:protein-disulfide reductase DsbD n=1 Tax=Acinetobacter faecalis TaxID=2665161 RepID=UPI002A90DD8D|nr:protein-disulfide reductase DsbD [Acinetobacter faecalis]MDY6460356.1 protein-disulfide reductase DsbD [Acinetobacter faecalis]